VSDWFRFCVYHAVYKLCPSSRTFCHSNIHTSIKQYSEFSLRVKKRKNQMNFELLIFHWFHCSVQQYLLFTC
jgi:hypothetical protein